ncbi:GNAT family N-acetyltransferase [Streptomyces erythrochromogenes]|uniref:GNAT family N-acetyltransferase n=1 Tax=Streptomyces erythrochromogenes TaxID=285574 RepID=UPI001FD745BF|nr:GNAT family N-acetyltransferase [Streptomyces erythrochromogenes]
MLQLIAPTTALHSSWLVAHHEWGTGLHEDGFGLGPSDEVESPEGFAAWVALLAGASGAKAAGTDHGCTYRWIVEGDRVEGGIALRHGLTGHVLEFGHIGYGIRPSSRGRGLATWALGRMLDEARALGLDRGTARLRGRQPCFGGNGGAGRWRPRRHPGHRTRSRTAVLDRTLICGSSGDPEPAVCRMRSTGPSSRVW